MIAANGDSGIRTVPHGDDRQKGTPRVASKGISKAEVYRWGIQDSPGTLEWIDKNQLCIDATYQRERISNERVLAIARDWSWVGCGALIVAHRKIDGIWVVVDGQHRWLASCKRTDIDRLPCVVFESSGIQSEARGFLNANTVRGSINSYERFRAATAAGNPLALQVKAMIESTGYKPGKGDFEFRVSCIDCLTRWYAKSSSVACSVWKLCCDICAGKSVPAFLFGALCYLEFILGRNGEGQSLTDTHNRDKLIAAGREGLLDAIHRARAFFANGGEKVFAEGIVTLLNKGRRSRLLPSVAGNTASKEGSE